ncbi:ABC transporter substrate-binding protein [Kribbella kalugense]|uniref:Carbohydrate ABC transporter substrate-binding protein (CUT1 family) n=1 Tax=Kribbella kalugense TaxID=2512221 RepID=A0A4R8A1Z5_9ACTN|nr:ABC transporter substrate-binding protein [Kribbella kalugense]TDW24225.1 carbohydrate ABC transporter substrate-binding protein (CUT1 family) [Kribbella kalugense]
MKKGLVLAPVIIATLIIGGCASSKPATSSDGHVTLNVVGYEGGGNEMADLPALNADFAKQYPNVKINFKYVDNGEYDTYNNTRLASGTAADVLMSDPRRIVRWQQQGYLSDLTDQPWVDRMIDNIRPYAQVKGRTYGLIQQNIPIGLYANLDLLQSVGINSVPQTWPQFIADLQTLKAHGKKGLIAGNQGGWYGEQLSLALGANLVPATWAGGYDGGKTRWSPTWGPVIDDIKQLLTTGLVDGTVMNGIDPFKDGLAQFVSGAWAFDVDGAWDMQHISSSAKFKLSLNAVPGGGDGTQPKTFTFVGSGWSVNAKSPQQQAAKDYVNFMSQPANDSRYLAAENCFSTLKDVPSPTLTDAAPIAQAFSDGRTVPSQVETLNFPNAEPEMQKVESQLFANPNTPTSTLLANLDNAIPATP